MGPGVQIPDTGPRRLALAESSVRIGNENAPKQSNESPISQHPTDTDGSAKCPLLFETPKKPAISDWFKGWCVVLKDF